MHFASSFVVTDDRIITGSGATLPVVAGMFHDPRTVLALAAERIGERGEGTVIVGRDWHSERPLDLAVTAGWTLLTSLATDLRTPGGTPVWTMWQRKGVTVHVGILPWIDADKTPLFWPEESPAVIAARLAAFHRATGAAWRGTAGMVGSAMLRSRWPHDKSPRWFGEPTPRGVGDMLWAREMTAEERKQGVVHAVDLNAQYLAAANVAEVGWRGLDHTGARPFDRRTSGLWLVAGDDVPPWFYGRRDGRPPLLSRRRFTDDGRVWVTTPILSLICQWSRKPPPVQDSWTSTDTRRLLRGWTETIRAARELAEDQRDTRLLSAIKRTCNETIGLMGKAGGRIYRPDWRSTIVDMARANLHRKIAHVHDQTGVWPLAARTDCLWYASAEVDPVKAAAGLGLRIGRGLGSWKVVDTMPASEYTPDVIKPQRIRNADR